MKLKVRVVPNAKKSEVIEGEILKVKVRAPPEGGRANEELIEVLAKHFGVKKSQVVILRGYRSREKLVEIIGKT